MLNKNQAKCFFMAVRLLNIKDLDKKTDKPNKHLIDSQ